MNIRDLIEELEMIADENDDGQEIEVRFASQPSWPFEYSIDGIVIAPKFDDQDNDTGQTIVYLGEGQQLGYLPVVVKNQLGWS